MKLTAKKGEYSDILFYEDIEDEFLKFHRGIRVLPAPFANDQNLHFEFIKRHEPGTKGWKDGGYELRGPNGELRAFHLDQLIIHPKVLGRKITFNDEEQEETKVIEVKPKSGKGRGRPSLDPEERERRAKAREYVPKGHGKKGRPPMDPELKKIKEALTVDKEKGKRGRKPLDPAVKAQRELEAAMKLEKHGKRGRGRPKSK
jgi:hypothetical protein